jgi:hypothetical protein
MGKESFLLVDVLTTCFAGVRSGFVSKAVRLVVAVPVVAETKLGRNGFGHVRLNFDGSEVRMGSVEKVASIFMPVA